MAVLAPLLVLVLVAFVVLVTVGALARFLYEDAWRTETGWARRPTLARTVELAFLGLNPLRAFMLWLVLSALALGFGAIPALFYLLGLL
jgi:hypothetical protein